MKEHTDTDCGQLALDRGDRACFVKQMGESLTNSAQPDGDLSRCYITGKGDDPSEWPEDLRVREFPASPASGPGGKGERE
jgi:hypothetical protein